MSDKNECDVTVVVFAVLVFSLPLTLFIPGFSIWDVVPKISITRFHIFSGEITWGQLNAVLLATLGVFFCLYLEIRKRRLDDMVENVLTVSQATDATLEMERERQTATARACVDLLDASTDHYEHLILLRDDLRRRDIQRQREPLLYQQPPTIDLSITDF